MIVTLKKNATSLIIHSNNDSTVSGSKGGYFGTNHRSPNLDWNTLSQLAQPRFLTAPPFSLLASILTLSTTDILLSTTTTQSQNTVKMNKKLSHARESAKQAADVHAYIQGTWSAPYSWDEYRLVNTIAAQSCVIVPQKVNSINTFWLNRPTQLLIQGQW